MNRTQDNKRPIEQILVGKAGQTTAHAGDISLTDSATGLVNMTDGKLMAFSSKGLGTRASNVTIAASDTVTAAREIFLTQGNASASDPTHQEPYPLPTRPYEQSEAISSQERIIYTYRSAKLPTFDKVLVGGAVASAGAINVLDESTYKMTISIFGRDIDEMYSGQTGKPIAAQPSYTSKDYTALTWNATKATDDIVQNLVAQINKNSAVLSISKGFQPKKPIVAFAIDSTGAQGVDPLTTAPGTVVPVMNTAEGLKTMVFTTNIINSFLTSDFPAGATIVPVDLSLAGGYANAGTDLEDANGDPYDTGVIVSGKADHILIMATDRTKSFEDRITQVKYHIQVGLADAFNYQTVGNQKIQKGTEGEGLKAQWSNYWKNTAGQRIYSAYRGFDTMRIDASNPVTADYYDAAIIEHYKVDQVGVANITKPFKVIILIPVTVSYVAPDEEEEDPATFTYTPDSGTASWVSTVVLPWINSTDHPIVSVLG